MPPVGKSHRFMDGKAHQIILKWKMKVPPEDREMENGYEIFQYLKSTLHFFFLYSSANIAQNFPFNCTV